MLLRLWVWASKWELLLEVWQQQRLEPLQRLFKEQCKESKVLLSLRGPRLLCFLIIRHSLSYKMYAQRPYLRLIRLRLNFKTYEMTTC